MTGTDFFVGFTSVAAPNALQYMQEVVPPSNYKKPEAIREHRERAEEGFLAKAHLQPVTGGILAVAVMDSRGDGVLATTDPRPGAASCQFVKWIIDNQFDEYPFGVSQSFTPSRMMWGFEIDKMLRIVGLEVMAYGEAFGLDPYPPLRLWYHNNGARDPLDILLGTTEKTIGLPGLCRYLGLNLSDLVLDAGRNPSAHCDSAVAVRELCIRTGLVYYKE